MQPFWGVYILCHLVLVSTVKLCSENVYSERVIPAAGKLRVAWHELILLYGIMPVCGNIFGNI